MGFSDSPSTLDALQNLGYRAEGWRWRWAPGDKGGEFPPHLALNGDLASDEDGFDGGRWPGADVNGDHCRCRTSVARYRDMATGRFARVPIAETD